MDSVTEDPYLWLEDITGDDALDWVRGRNAPTLGDLVGDREVALRRWSVGELGVDRSARAARPQPQRGIGASR